MKKTLVLVLILLGITSFMFAGGKSQQDAPTLVWWQFGSMAPGDLEESTKIMSDYSYGKIGVRFEIKILNWDQLGIVANTGEYFDLIWANEELYTRFTSINLLADITDSVKTAAPGLWNFIPLALWDGAKINDRIFGVPVYKDSSQTFFAFIDDQYVQKYKIDAGIKTIADFDKVFRTMKAGEGRRFYPILTAKYSTIFPVSQIYDHLNAALPYVLGVPYNDASRRVVSILEQPGVQEKYRIIHSWYTDGLINPDAPYLLEGPRQAPYIFDQAWPSKAVTLATLQGVRKYVPLQLTGSILSTGSARGSMVALNANSKYKSEALKFLELVNTDHTFRDMLAYGIEGKHFSYVSPNVVHKLTDTWSLYEWVQGTFFTLSTTDDQPSDTWDEVRRQNETAVPSVMNGFSMDISGVQNEVINCGTVMNRFQPELSLGVSDPDLVIPQYLSALRAAGFDRIITEAQRQVDAWARNR